MNSSKIVEIKILFQQAWLKEFNKPLPKAKPADFKNNVLQLKYSIEEKTGIPIIQERRLSDIINGIMEIDGKTPSDKLVDAFSHFVLEKEKLNTNELKIWERNKTYRLQQNWKEFLDKQGLLIKPIEGSKSQKRKSRKNLYFYTSWIMALLLFLATIRMLGLSEVAKGYDLSSLGEITNEEAPYKYIHANEDDILELILVGGTLKITLDTCFEVFKNMLSRKKDPVDLTVLLLDSTSQVLKYYERKLIDPDQHKTKTDLLHSIRQLEKLKSVSLPDLLKVYLIDHPLRRKIIYVKTKKEEICFVESYPFHGEQRNGNKSLYMKYIKTENIDSPTLIIPFDFFLKTVENYVENNDYKKEILVSH